MQKQDKAKSKGHGRNAAAVYTGATTIDVKLEGFEQGNFCPMDCGGRLYSIEPGITLRLTGSPIAAATKYLLEKLRCALCGYIVTASLPDNVDKNKYDASIRSVLAVNKYYLGLPFKRIETYQAMLGVPLPDATQFDLVETVADSAFPVYKQLVHFAAQSKLVHNDDTRVKILSVIKENKALDNGERTGTYTTGLIAYHDNHTISLFISGRQHSGENLRDVLLERDLNLGPVMQMCDALPANNPKGLPDTLKIILLNCLSHGRRKFYELFDHFPEECNVVIDALAQVYKHDDYCKAHQLDAQQRLAYHQEKSRPVMETLHVWLKQRIDGCFVEPNSSLGKAMSASQKS